MSKVVLIYAIVQLITTAYGLAVIESIRPIVEEKLRDQGYIKNKNSLYNFNYTLKNIGRGFIPFYYLVKAINIINDKSSVDKKVNEEINSGHYVNENDLNIDESSEVDLTDSIYKDPYDFAFEKPEKYTARKNDIEIYDTYETPQDYIERISTKEDELSLTPFEYDGKVVEHVVVKNDVTKKDIAKALTELSVSELEILRSKIAELEEIKKERKLKLEKEVA